MIEKDKDVLIESAENVTQQPFYKLYTKALKDRFNELVSEVILSDEPQETRLLQGQLRMLQQVVELPHVLLSNLNHVEGDEK